MAATGGKMTKSRVNPYITRGLKTMVEFSRSKQRSVYQQWFIYQVDPKKIDRT